MENQRFPRSPKRQVSLELGAQCHPNGAPMRHSALVALQGMFHVRYFEWIPLPGPSPDQIPSTDVTVHPTVEGGGTQSWRSPQAGKGSFVHWCWGCMEAGRLARMGLCAWPCPYLHPGLHQVQPQRQGLPHEHVRVVALVESLLQLLQLPAGEIGARPSSLTTGAFLIRVHRVWERGRKTVILTSELRLGS